MSKIRIFVTHTPNKDDMIVGNPLMIDVIAGADFQKKDIPDGMVGDNSGINISKKNKSYCELTTQYWAWKNVDADYYGFCHYRRFLSLSNKKIFLEENLSERGQIISKILCNETINKYSLSDEKIAEEFVEKYDCILPLKQDLRKLPTPKGKTSSVYAHFAAHDRVFIHEPDLKVLIEILGEKYPEYKEDADEYMRNPYFWGFNCFVLKKEYFFSLCEFEFTILEEMEKRLKTAMYNRQTSRVYGFMGEILSCIFFYHMQKTKPELKIAETQLIYFENTEKQRKIEPIDKKITPVVFYMDRISPHLFDITINSFIKNCKNEHIYDLIILHHNLPAEYRNAFSLKLAAIDHISVRFFDCENVFRISDEIGKKIEDVRILLPWILDKYDKAVLLNWNVMINGDIDILLEHDIKDYFIAGVRDVLMIGKAFDVKRDYEKYLRKEVKIEKLSRMINTDVCLLNLSQIRKKIDVSDVLIDFHSGEIQSLNVKERLNQLLQSNLEILPQTWNYYYTEDLEEKRLINQVPLSLADEYNLAAEGPIVTTYNPHIMYSNSVSRFCLNYWKMVKESDFYYLFLNRSMELVKQGGQESWFMSKMNGWFLCVQDHGLPYTIGYTAEKAIKTVLRKPHK